MYTYNPHWGCLLWQAERLPGASSFRHPLYMRPSPQTAILLYWLLWFFISLSVITPKEWCKKMAVFVKKKFPFLSFTASFLTFLSGIPVSSFYSLRFFVIFGKVSDTLVCLGVRVQGMQGTVVRETEGGRMGTTGIHMDKQDQWSWDKKQESDTNMTKVFLS